MLRARIVATSAVALLLLVPLWHWPTRSTAQARPNILVIVTDDQREGMGVMRDTRTWFADAGTSYRRAYVTTPTCCPSRASILTGRYVHNHHVDNLHPATVLDQQTTLNFYLQRAGYRTGLFGKYLNTWPVATTPPYWDRFAFFQNSTSETYVGDDWNVQGTVRSVGEYATGYMATRAEQFIRNSSQPWFLYLSTPNPHGPWTTEPEYADVDVGGWDGNPAVSEKDKSDKPPYVQQSSHTLEQGARLRRKQLRTLYSVDDMIERVFSVMEETGQLDNTLAIFLSDNGVLWGEHGRTAKSVPYTQAINVPMFARWPGHVVAGANDYRLVANIDVAPTALEAAGITDLNSPLDGRSMLSSYSRSRLLTEFFDSLSSAPPWASTVTKTYQYIEYNDGSGFREYYDMVRDPWQLDNLFNDGVSGNEPRDPAALASQLARDERCSGSTCP
jgi:arylsulfatase A-like enzyme